MAKEAAEILRRQKELMDDPAVKSIVELLEIVAAGERDHSRDHLARKLRRLGYDSITLVTEQLANDQELYTGVVISRSFTNPKSYINLTKERTNSAALLVATDFTLFLEDSLNQEVAVVPDDGTGLYKFLDPRTESEYATMQVQSGQDLTIAGTFTERSSVNWKSYVHRAMHDYAAGFGLATDKDPYTYQIGD